MTEEYNDWELELRVFNAAAIGGGHPEMTREELNQLIRDLWTAYCDMEELYEDTRKLYHNALEQAAM